MFGRFGRGRRHCQAVYIVISGHPAGTQLQEGIPHMRNDESYEIERKEDDALIGHLLGRLVSGLGNVEKIGVVACHG